LVYLGKKLCFIEKFTVCAETYGINQTAKTLVVIQTGTTIGSDHQLTYVKVSVFDIFYQGQKTLVGCNFSSGETDLVGLS
jgi:hypothetical protein